MIECIWKHPIAQYPISSDEFSIVYESSAKKAVKLQPSCVWKKKKNSKEKSCKEERNEKNGTLWDVVLVYACEKINTDETVNEKCEEKKNWRISSASDNVLLFFLGLMHENNVRVIAGVIKKVF